MILLVSLIPSTTYIMYSKSKTNRFQKRIPEEILLTSPIEEMTLSTEQEGDEQFFWVMYPSGPELERATLLSVGTDCYVYMENSCIDTKGVSNAVSQCDEIREAFDSDIYPKGTELAGNPDGTLGDIDGDPRVTVYIGPFFEKSGGLLGGFYEAMNDLEGTYSNYREMVFIDVDRPVAEAICTITHEFNHLIWFNHEMDEAYFLLEGLANLAIQYTGYRSTIVEEQVRRFTESPQDSLLYFNIIADNYYWDVSYGQSYLFVTYLYERFGTDFIRSLVSIPEDGAVAVDVALSNGGYNLSFNDVYLDWIVACTLNNPEIYGGIYGFTSENHTIDCRFSIGADYPLEKSNITFNYYGFRARGLYSPPDNMILKIERPTLGDLGIAIAISDDEGWHVTQTLHTEDSTEITEHIEGTNIQEVYIIISLMSEDTPSEFGLIYDLDETPSLDLDYTISEEVPSESTSDGVPTEFQDMNILFLSISGLLIVIVVIVVIHNKRSKVATMI